MLALFNMSETWGATTLAGTSRVALGAEFGATDVRLVKIDTIACCCHFLFVILSLPRSFFFFFLPLPLSLEV